MVIIISIFSPIKYDINAQIHTIDEDENSTLYDDEEWGDPGASLTKYDITIRPAKKNIKIGKSFTINIIPKPGSIWEELTKKEWKEFCEDEFDFIIFQSLNSKVATVNRLTGKVTGRKKGSTSIKTIAHMSNGETVSFRTKIEVQN